MRIHARKFFCAAALTLAASTCGGAATAKDDRVKIDNEQTRVLVVKSKAGAKSALHEHPMNRVMIYLDPGKITLTDLAGKVQTLNFKAGQALWSPATGQHVSVNESGHPVRIVEVEIKSKPVSAAIPAKPAELDPVKVDPEHYKVEMENDQVRVIRAHYGPHEKGVMHEHTLNRVVTYLTDSRMRVTTPDGTSKVAVNSAGDVTWGTHAKHIEQNLNGKPFEVVVVEFKN